MPFEIFIIPGLICLIIGFMRGVAGFKKQAGR